MTTEGIDPWMEELKRIPPNVPSVTPADHANTVRETLRWLSYEEAEGHVEDALAALDALQPQAEEGADEATGRRMAEDERERLRKRAEAAEAERDHARDALREIASTDFDEPSDFSELGRIARAALGEAT